VCPLFSSQLDGRAVEARERPARAPGLRCTTCGQSANEQDQAPYRSISSFEHGAARLHWGVEGRVDNLGHTEAGPGRLNRDAPPMTNNKVGNLGVISPQNLSENSANPCAARRVEAKFTCA